jgi:hypothetical protein
MESKVWGWMKGDQSNWSNLSLEKKKEKTKPYGVKANVLLGILFCRSRHNCVIVFTIDSGNIKRGTLKLNQLYMPSSVMQMQPTN